MDREASAFEARSAADAAEAKPESPGARKSVVLVVDDIDSIRFAIREFLSGEFEVREAANGREALAACRAEPIDLVITDIRMPVMGGLELIRALHEEFPQTRYALMTAYNVDDYIRFAREERVWNIIPKTTFLDLHSIRTLARKLLGAGIFGVQQYFPAARVERVSIPDLHRRRRKLGDETPPPPELVEEALAPDEFLVCRVTSPGENNAVCDKASELLIACGAPSVTRMILEELAANAMIHAPHGGDRPPADRSGAHDLHPMAPADAFDVGFGILNQNAVVSVVDYHGALRRESILEKLERQTTADPRTGLPLGLTDPHGRGLYISRENADHLVFNIEPGKRTEVIGVLPLESLVRTRSISFFQVGD